MFSNQYRVLKIVLTLGVMMALGWYALVTSHAAARDRHLSLLQCLTLPSSCHGRQFEARGKTVESGGKVRIVHLRMGKTAQGAPLFDARHPIKVTDIPLDLEGGKPFRMVIQFDSAGSARLVKIDREKGWIRLFKYLVSILGLGWALAIFNKNYRLSIMRGFVFEPR